MNVEQTFIGTNYTYDLNQELNSIRIIKRKNSGIDDEDDNSSSSMYRPKTILVFGIVLAAIGIAGAIYYGSQFVKEEEVSPNSNQPYTAVSPIKNVIPVELEVAFVVVMLAGFGILSYGVVATKFNTPTDFYPV
jgi:hypothetical protein